MKQSNDFATASRLSVDLDVKAKLKGKVPTKVDKKNINDLIEIYNKQYPYPHPESLELAIEDALAHTDNKNVKKGDMIRTMSLPKRFVTILKISYPLIITDKVQYGWFLKNFPEFDLRKY